MSPQKAKGQPKAAKKPNALTAALKAEKKLLAAVLVVVVILGIGAHWASDKAGTWSRLAASDRAQARADNAEWQLGQKIAAHGREWRRRLSTVEVALPTKEDQPGFVSAMAALASKCQAAWSSSSWAPGQAMGGQQTWQVQATVTGTLGGVLCVVSGLANLPRAVNLTALSMTDEADSGWQATLSLNTFARDGGNR